ncbi:ABC-2 type transport system permease protein [Microbacterium halimionae]|uniref:ABC-2 type transport system permease protein n=1 Tax=Microbacterium halimionae TaxID=1526413 RepID=A0A7W3JQ53_9MICO|nr:ABC transporter permease [Microbacterium halimionae]MBA8816936.1 ABC-2 type transport system permease protein [Microbacterium halimionae]NII94525.1 ABC-2 type transport system permease protein [Microbacterium halimionae]
MSTASHTSPTTAQSIRLVAEREIGSRLRSKAFVISTLILFAIALAAVVWGGFTASSTSATTIAVTTETSSLVPDAAGLEVTAASSADEALALVEDGTVSAALVPSSAVPEAEAGAFDFTVVGDTELPSGLLQSLSQVPATYLLEPPSTDFLLRYFVALGFGIVFLLAASTFGGTIAQSVVEEKQTRVVELLISAIPVRALLAGKVIGNTILAMAQILVLAAIAVVGLTVTDQQLVLAGLGGPLVWFAIFFLLGFVLLASLFAAAGAMVSRQEDIGATTAPITMLVMLPYFLVIFFNDNPLVLTVMSYVPFSAPVGMPLRLYLGEAQWWEPLVSLVVLAATCIAAILVASRIYSGSLLRMGARVKLVDALKSR